MNKERLRKDQLEEFTWDLGQMYPSMEDLEQDVSKVEKGIVDLVAQRGTVGKSEQTLLSFLKKSEEIERILYRLETYAFRKYDEDISNVDSQALLGKMKNLANRYASETAFFVPEILENEFSKIEGFLNKEKELEPYRLLLEHIFRMKPYTLSEKEEKILSNLSMPLGESEQIADIVRDSELQFGTILDEEGKEVLLTNENYLIYNKSKNREVRKNAFLTMYHSYEKYKETLTATLLGHVAATSKVNQIRGFSNSLDASLFHNRVPRIVYENLKAVVHERMDLMDTYIQLKKKVLQIKDFALYDTYVNLEGESEKKYTYEEAKQIVLDVVSVFGEEYKKTIERAFQERWIDVYPNKGKRGGAYSAGSYDTYPYVLLNFQGNYHDVSTLAHELGHSMHTYYSNHNQSFYNSNYKIFVAEVASTVNEMLLNYYMLEHTEDVKEKKSILSEMMELFKSTIYRQTMFSEFEEYLFDTYEKTGVFTNQMLCDKYYELNQTYFGKHVHINDEIRYEWERVPHFYYNFYVYQYATGLSAACAIVDRIRKKEKNAVSDYLSFLKTGDSLDPVDELKVAGVDMTTKEPIERALDMFEEIMMEYQKL